MQQASVACLVALLIACSVAAQAVSPSRGEMSQARSWFRERLGPSAREIPFSFTFAGEASQGLIRRWKSVRTSEKLDGGRTRHTTTWRSPDSGLEVRCVAVTYSDFPVVEWTLWFANRGDTDTPIIEDIQALDAAFPGQGTAALHHNAGSLADGNDYSPRVTPLPAGASKRFSAAGGRPTNTDLSYFNLAWPSGGVARGSDLGTSPCPATRGAR